MIRESEFLLEDVRCFRGEQRARLRPITLLVGENSTGKTTFLACYGVLHRLLSESGIPGIRLDFNKDPFSMGSLRNIVRSQRGPLGRIDEFSLGFSLSLGRTNRSTPLMIRVAFSESGSQPILSAISYQFNSFSFSLRRGDKPATTVFQTEYFETEFDFVLDEDWHYRLEHLTYGTESYSKASKHVQQVMDYLAQVASEFRKFGRMRGFFTWTNEFPILLPIAPLRSRPKRTYDPIGETASPEGEHIPMLMMKLSRTDKTGWSQLHDNLVAFGDSSGLFSDIAVKRHGRQMSDPFQLQVKVRANSRANIMDVGYGVSQSLPILVDVRGHSKCVFLLQQPEVHLHPRAQAELATLFVDSYNKSGNRFLVETHSDYIVDRIRILTKNGVVDPSDVSILYFEPKGNSAQIHNISLDANGNLQNVPPGYRDFFIRESDRLLGFDD